MGRLEEKQGSDRVRAEIKNGNMMGCGSLTSRMRDCKDKGTNILQGLHIHIPKVSKQGRKN